MREMFERKERLQVDNVPQLEKRIKQSQIKLGQLKSRPEGIKPEEEDKIEEGIKRDRHAIKVAKERRVFIKECVRDELLHFQSSQYHVSRYVFCGPFND